MRSVCRHLADALDHCSGSTLQQRWNDLEKGFWPRWKAGINRPGGTYWTWGARVLISARIVVPSLDMLANVRANQWVAHLPDDHPLAQGHRALLSASAPITWTSSFNRHLAVCNGLRLLLARGYDSLHYIKDDDLKLLSSRFREIVRQQWNFYPLSTIRELEEYWVQLSDVTILELVIVPDISRRAVRASLKSLRLY